MQLLSFDHRRPFTVTLSAALIMSALANTAPADEPLRKQTNSLGMTFVEIKPGEFVMGEENYNRVSGHHRASIQVGQGFDFDRPSLPVRLTRPFAIGTHEVTVGQFRAFVEATGYRTDAEKSGRGASVYHSDVKNEVDRFTREPANSWRDPGFVQHDNHPVVCVSWHDAIQFCIWLGKTDGGKYRLPTEAEWEFACRAGTKTTYSCGDDPVDLYAHANVGDAALERALPGTVSRQQVDHLGPDDGDGFAYTSAVGRYRPNAWGLYDMHGNAWEWCRDRFQDRYYTTLNADVQARRRARQSEHIVDPLGPETTPQHDYGDWRSLRGGSWYVSPINCRSATRSFAEASEAFSYIGFRVVREIDATEK